MIKIEQLSKAFAVTRRGTLKAWRTPAPPPVQAVRDVSLSAPAGQITGLLGPNGAGKTTTLRVLAGLIKPDAGSISVDGIDVLAQPHAALQRMGVLSDARDRKSVV